jgi:glyoxylase-like metal-dependent hydrolase (beta-lactamase superfamily II)
MKIEFPKLECIHPIIIPFEIVPDLLTANVYVLGKKELTLIDPGPGIGGAIDRIIEGIESSGLNINDIQRILITHGHMDHYGLTTRIREKIDHPIEVFLHPEDSWRVTPEFFEKKQWNSELESIIELTDIPREEFGRIKRRINGYYSIAGPIENVSKIEDNDEFKGDGYHLRVIHAPGHSPGLCCFYEMRNKVLFSGDHILKHITPNPLISLNRERLRDKKYQSLMAYKSSLEKVSKLDVRYVFPGHGECIDDMNEILERYKIHQEERTDLVWQAIRKKEVPIYYLVDDVFPGLSKGDLFLALSEIIAHLELLVNEGRAEVADAGPPVIYRALE